MATDNKLMTASQIKAVTDTKLDASKVYNGLDQTVAGYVLDARQGKILKEMAENAVSSVTINGDYLQVGSTDLTIPYATKAQKDASGNTITETYAPIASPNLTGTPTAPTANAGTNSTQIATTAFVTNAVSSMAAAAEAMVFKGTVDSAAGLPATHKQGWTYKVTTAGQYVGVQCEIGDMIICIADGTAASDSDWTVVQANIDGAVIGPASAVDSRIAVFDGTTGKVIKDSGFTIGTSVPSGAVFTDTDTSVTSAANHYTPTRDTSADKTADATGATAEWGIDVVKGVTVQTDSKGHVTGVAVTSGKIPTNPNTDTHRPIQVNGTQVLGDNTTALNLAAGSNVSLSESSGTVTISATDTTYESKAAAANGIEVSLVTTGEKATWNAKTSNEGTVTSVAAGVGLAGGSITTSGTIKAKLKSETALENNAVAATETAGRVYPVAVDSSGDLAVNVPWTDTDTTYSAGTGIDITNDIVTNTGVRSVASGTTNGTISVNTNGTDAEVAVAGLGSSAYAAIANNLTTTVTGSVLDASQGKILSDEIETKAERFTFTVGVPVSAWVKSSSIYIATVAVNGIKSDDDGGGIGILQTGNEEVDNEIRSSWSNVVRVTTDNNSITLYSIQQPTVLIPLLIEIFRSKEEKKTGIIGLDTNSVTIDNIGDSTTVGFFKFGGTVSASSGNETVATVSVNNNEIIISKVGVGNTEITVSLSGNDEYTGASETITVIGPPPPPSIFGVVWNYDNSSTALTRLTPSTDPNGYVNTTILTDPVPAVGTDSGSSQFDSYMPWKGMEEYNVANNAITYKKGDSGFSRSNDTVVYIPEFYYKIVKDTTNSKHYFYVADHAITGFEKHPGSGAYVGKYPLGSGYVCKTGVAPQVSMTRATARSSIKSNLGSKWSQWGLHHWNAIQLLYVVEFADWNSQNKIGQGYTNSSNSSAISSGGTDSMTYHTGRPSGTNNMVAVQYRGIENLWGNVYQWVDGVNFNSRSIYYCADPSKYADDTTTNYTSAGFSLPSGSNYYISQLGSSSNANWLMLGNADAGSNSTYIPDYLDSDTGWRVLFVGGVWNYGLDAGLFYCDAYYSSSDSASGIGSRPIFIP